MKDKRDSPTSPREVESEKARDEGEKPLLNANPRLPFPQKFARHALDTQFAKFLDMLEQLHITLPFTDALKQMPTYSSFLKELLSGKRSDDEGCETVNLTEHCSAILQRKIPPKLNDPGNFSIPCSIKGVKFDNALCDLGASVSIMAYVVYKKLGLGELSSTQVTLQFADHSIKLPLGKAEDVPLKVGKFTYLVDFVVLDIEAL